MHSAAVTFLGLVGPFDRASVADANATACDTAAVTSSSARSALRYPQAGVIVPARKQPHTTSPQRPSTDHAIRFH